jgi:dTDP-4-amino-4,6-dideoxygalactose transaminase
MWRHPLTDISVTEDDVEAVLECLQSGWLTMGPRTQAFEAAFAEHVGSAHAVAVSSGTAALHLAMVAAGLGPGDEAVVPALTFVATAAAVRYTGATPVLCDIKGAHDLNVDPDSVLACVTPRTRAVVAVHLMGYPADVLALRELCDERGIRLIEDAAQAVDAQVGDREVGTVGDLGCFSFFSKKQLCVGEGGMVLTDDAELAAVVRRVRAHGLTSATWERHRGYAAGYDVVEFGFNYRLDEPRAALGLSRLPRLRDDIEARRRNVIRYRARLADVPGIELPWDDAAVAASSHFAFPVLVADRERRNDLRSGLRELGIQTTFYPSLSELTAYDDARGSVPRAEEMAARHCALPLWSHMQPEAIDEVSDAVATVVAATVGASREG